MRIAQIVTQMEAGGAQRIAYLLHEGLRSIGHESELLFMYTKRPFYAGLEGVTSLLDRRPSSGDYVQIVRTLYSNLRKLKPDVLITHTHYANVLGQVVATAAGVRRRIAVHHSLLHTYPAGARLADWLLGQTGAYTRMVGVSDEVVRTANSYPRRYGCRIQRIYNGLPFHDAPLKDPFAAWGIPRDKPLLLSVGRLSRQKNHSTLFKAVQKIPHVHLAVVGAGELLWELQREINSLDLVDRVSFIGEIPTDDVQALLKAADIFVFPSLFEAVPLAVVEAMQVGLPIVASNIPALREVLGNAAIFVDPRDPSDFAKAICCVLENPALANDLGHQAASRANLFSLERMIAEYDSLIRQ
jgi:glycosyltransferase involved in cell wall biosynthesis